ncbi:MAG: anti-sigma factor family protein [Micromonosporaceae bacterium]
MNDHADLGTIAAFREGLLDGPASELVGDHLARCPVCAERGAALAQVTTRLASAPALPMPPELSRRLDEALAAEIAVASRAIGTSVDGTPLADHGRTELNAKGRHTTGSPNTGPPGRVSSTTRPASRAAHERTSRPPSAAKRPGRARGRMATALRPLAAAAAICLIAGGGFLLLRSAGVTSSSFGSSGGARHAQVGKAPPAMNGAAAPVTAAVVQSQTPYRSGQLRAQAAVTLERYRNRIIPPKTGAITMPMQPNLSTALSGCLQRVAQGQRRVLVDNASYDGRKVIVIIVPAAGAQPGQVWVVEQGCSGSASHVIAHSRLP